MSSSRTDAQGRKTLSSLAFPSRTRRRIHTRPLFWPAFIPFIVLSGVLVNWAFLAGLVYAAPLAPFSAPGHNTLQQFEQQGQQSTANQGPFVRPGSDPGALQPQKNVVTTPSLPGVEPATMQDLDYTLDDSFVLNRPTMATSTQPATIQGTAIPAGTGPLVATGTDGRLEVDVPRGSLDFSKAALAHGGAPVSQLILQIHQISGHYIEADSILGTYQIQVVDSLGDVVQGVTLTKPITIVYHYQSWEMQDLNLNPNEIYLAWSGQLAVARAAGQSTAGLVIPMTNNATAQTLTAQSTLIAGPFTSGGTPEIEAPAKPDLFEASGNDGQYSYTYPLSVAPGPDGFVPQLQLVYSSQSSNERYNRRAPAGDEGEGFSLSLGSITAAQYPSSSTGGAATWYSINGVDGVSDKLVPIPGKAGYYETEHISHLSVYFTGTYWRVFGEDGTHYELGNTSDSTQTDSSGTYEWDMNKILAPYNSTSQVKTMFITYLQDSPSSGTIRDAGIKQIQYGFATSTSATSLSLVSGTVDFHYHMPSVPSGQSAFATAYGTNYHCASSPPFSTTLRCDDPPTYNSLPSPDVMATMSLDSVTSYSGSDSSGSPAYSYAFSYQDNPFVTNYYDPVTGADQSAAGEDLLTQIMPSVFVQGTSHARKAVVFSYTGALRDSFYNPTSGEYGGQTYWHYLSSYEDLATGEGASISYQTADGNMDGTPYTTDSQGHVTDDRFDPLYCATNANDSDPSKHCTGTYAHPEEDNWSLQVVTAIAALGTDSSGNTTVATTSYHYALAAVSSSNMPVGCNPITGSGVPPQEADCVADNWSPGYDGIVQHDGDWQDYYHAELRGFNIVYTTSASNNLTVGYYFASEGWWTAESNGANYNGGQMYQQDVYQGDVEAPSALLQETDTDYSGVSTDPAGNPYGTINTCNGNESPVYNPCVVAPLETKITTYNGDGGSSNAPWVDTTYTYDDISTSSGYTYSGYHNLTQEVISSSNAPTITKKWTYKTTDETDSGTGRQTYYDVDKVSHSEVDDAGGHVWACQDTTYDEAGGGVSGGSAPQAGWPTTSTDYSTCGNSSTALTSYTGYDQYGNVVATVDPLAVANPGLYSGHGCTLATAPAYLNTSWTSGRFTSCTTYDTSTSADLPLTQINALGQSSSASYDYTSGGGLPSSTVDLNSQTTSYSYSYDSNGNETINVKAPGEGGSYTSRQVENAQCTSTSTLPCYEIDANTLLYSSAISRTFYDAEGRAVETRTPGPTPGDDTVVMTVYNDQNNTVWTSEPFEVTDGSGWLDPTTTKDINGTAPAGTTTFSDALGRTIAIQDLNFGSAQEPGIACSTVLSGTYTSCTTYSIGQAVGDSTYYELTTGVDPNGHVSQSLSDAPGNVRYTQTYSGVYGGTLAIAEQTQTQYNALGKPTSVAVIDEQPQSGENPTGVTTTMTYDDLGRLLTMTDPDQGTFTSSYDPDGHVLSVVQTSGSNSRTLGFNYDLLGRTGCEQTAAPTINATGACSAGNPLVQNTYDTTFLGVKGTTDFPVGHLTQSIATTSYPDGTSATTTEQFQTDTRGRTVTEQMQLSLPSAWNVSTALPTFQVTQAYNDANQPTTTSANAVNATYSFTQVYDPTNGVLQGLSNNGNSTSNLATLAYSEYAQLAGLTLLNGASSSPTSLESSAFSYDGDLRPTSLTANWLPGSGNSGQILAQGRSYDNASNVTSVNTTFAAVPGKSGSGGAETQNFCYDEQNRLTWSGNGGTQPGAGNGTCGSGTLSSGLSGAGYTAPYTYTNLGQIWQGPVNGNGTSEQYLYCNSAPHQLSGIYPTGTTCANKGSATAVYSASYDPWGNETSRTYNSVTATLSYDALNRLVGYTAGSSSQEFYVYDASGERVLTRSTSGSATTLTTYPFGLQELSYTGSGTYTSQIDYYSIAGHLIGWSNGTTTTYDLTDAQGSVLTSFSSSTILGEQLYGPYGDQRYIEGSLGSDKGYTGQFTDAVSGLDYYNARWYDPVMGQFLSADSVQGNAAGMDPYSYVAGNPETRTDPTGKYLTDGSPYDRAYIEPDTNGGGGITLRVYTPRNPANPDFHQEWVNVTHFRKPGKYDPNGTYEADNTTGHQQGKPDHYPHVTPKSVAQDADNNFHSIASVLGSIPESELISLLVNAGSLKFGPMLTGMVGAILAMLSYLSTIASGMANGFDVEAEQKDSWFTLTNIIVKGGDIVTTAASTGFTDDVKLLGTAGLGLAIFAIPCGICQAIGGALMVEGITTSAVVSIGVAALTDEANDYIDTQEGLVSE